MQDDSGINPAALGALLNGDPLNFIVAATPGGIEAQEAAGQRKLVGDQTLPKKCGDRATYEAMGIEFAQEADEIFVFALLPDGWGKRPTEHSMWSDLVDERGRKRASIFYKAAFYDRSAHMSPCCFFSIKFPEADNYKIATVVDADGVEHFRAESEDDFDRTACANWLAENKPEHADPLAYWN